MILVLGHVVTPQLERLVTRLLNPLHLRPLEVRLPVDGRRLGVSESTGHAPDGLLGVRVEEGLHARVVTQVEEVEEFLRHVVGVEREVFIADGSEIEGNDQKNGDSVIPLSNSFVEKPHKKRRFCNATFKQFCTEASYNHLAISLHKELVKNTPFTRTNVNFIALIKHKFEKLKKKKYYD